MGHSEEDAVHKIPLKQKKKKALVKSAENFSIGLILNPL